MDDPQTTQEVSWMIHRPHRKCVVDGPHTTQEVVQTMQSVLWMVHITQRIDNDEIIQDSGVMGDIMTHELTQRLPDGRSEYMDLFKRN